MIAVRSFMEFEPEWLHLQEEIHGKPCIPVVVEALQHERALILLTFLADQGINARLLEEKKMGYPIPRNELDGSSTRKSVAESVRLVMVEEEGKIYREKAKKMRGLFGD
ncbi:hypothetical protein GH714_042343 [Hevea brasiliensis]|uniref:Uncharacterized protein n=1 Tax=Hevea brasiliensis TaxID=3981 RepID=A0A6A6K8Z7_HEVBR|nr:hypothetical protein GH714_042343 [Hevea brasiliensis]